MIHASLIAIPEAGASLVGAYELLASVGTAWNTVVQDAHAEPVFRPQLVSEHVGALQLAAHWSVRPQATLDEVTKTDVVIIPPLWIGRDETFAGRHARLKHWIVERHGEGAIVCAACSGTLLLADTGLLDGEAATTHWAWIDSLRQHYRKVLVHGEKVLVEAGADRRLITSGSHAAWTDLLLYVIGRLRGREAAVQTAKFFLLQWHGEGQSPYMAFRERLDHGDAAIRQAQEWLREHFSHPNAIDALEQQGGLAPRTFKRRFKRATGLTPVTYLQKLRIERAKALLEAGETPVDQVGWRVGYEDTAHFRRLFKRITSLRPGEYRRKFRLPFGAP